MHSQINFAYSWQWNYGYLILAVAVSALLLLSWFRKWPKLLTGILAAVTLWSTVAFGMVRFGFDMNGRASLPTEAFLASGTGRVLDIGAGTGRSTLMVLEARPHVTIVALDSFSNSYVLHFGDAGNGESVPDQGRERLMANLKAAGVDQRASVVAADMRELPFEPAAFEGVVSAYTFEHLGRKDTRTSLAEAFRVLKPGGDFLLMVLAKDAWLTFVQGPLALHSHMPNRESWEANLREAGFQVLESGSRPATLYFLARKP